MNKLNVCFLMLPMLFMSLVSFAKLSEKATTSNTEKSDLAALGVIEQVINENTVLLLQKGLEINKSNHPLDGSQEKCLISFESKQKVKKITIKDSVKWLVTDKILSKADGDQPAQVIFTLVPVNQKSHSAKTSGYKINLTCDLGTEIQDISSKITIDKTQKKAELDLSNGSEEIGLTSDQIRKKWKQQNGGRKPPIRGNNIGNGGLE